MSDQKAGHSGHGHGHTEKPASPETQGQGAEVTTPRQDQIERNEEIRSEQQGSEPTHAPTDEERAAAQTPPNEPLKAGEEPETGSTPA